MGKSFAAVSAMVFVLISGHLGGNCGQYIDCDVMGMVVAFDGESYASFYRPI